MQFRRVIVVAGLIMASLAATGARAEGKKLRALIIDGQNNHQWQTTTPVLKEALEASGRFDVDVSTSPPARGDMSGFRPRFHDCDVVVSNYNGDPWSDQTREEFEAYVRGGGGFVSVHAADNAFPDWSQYNEMIGLGGWYGRDEKSGPYVYIRDGEIVRDNSPGSGGHHGPQHEFVVETRLPDHPIMKGLPPAWRHAQDELYSKLRGPARNMTILATAYADPEQGGTGRDEPMLMVLPYGQGRVFHTVLGHADYSMKCVGFFTTLARGAEWAATGEVTLEVPADFPGPDAVAVPGGVSQQLWLEWPGGGGPGAGKHVVLVAGDEEYRSEEALPQLAKILATHHGFRCTVLFPIDPETGEINPERQDSIPGLEALDDADLMIIATRFRNLADEQMKHVVDYVAAGKPIIGMRTATHAFNIPADRKFASYSFNSSSWDGGFGRQILGETWINHHGDHGKQSCRGIVVADQADHPILRGIASGDIWGPTDVYGVRLPLPAGCEPLVLGEVVDGMSPTDPPLPGAKNDPMMPIAWVRNIPSADGSLVRVFTTTMGAATDLASEGLRRLLVNAAYWCTGLEDEIVAGADVALVGDYRPTPFGFGGYVKGKVPADYQ